ncbi:saccharopine dehydrogenase C-terminal domain-containing protein [Planctomycetota bacterium]
MPKVAVLGAGMVARPLVRYLLDLPDFNVAVATRMISKAVLEIIDEHPRGEAKTLNVKDTPLLAGEVKSADIVVSLVPYEYHVTVAKLCLKYKKHLVTTSYVGDDMKALDGEAKEAGVTLLNECGLDPGIDHMSAMRIIHDVERNGGKIVSFRSTTGALPSHEANDNPFGYKFSWSPRGVLLASRNAAKWLEDGQEVSIPGEQLFENYYLLDVPGAGALENYPNRNSVPYKEIYGLQDATTVYRGTFRMTGWCETLRRIVALGWLQEDPIAGFSGKTYGDLTRQLIGTSADANLIGATAEFLQVAPYSAVIKRLEWLGLFSDRALPEDRDTPLDYLNVLSLEKMPLAEGERDMVVMHHEFVAEFASGKRERITSTLVNYGIPGEDSSIARTVSLPAAIAVKMLLEGKISVRGVFIPVQPEIYNPILDELEPVGITFVERKTAL